jgi:hypothetical protein
MIPPGKDIEPPKLAGGFYFGNSGLFPGTYLGQMSVLKLTMAISGRICPGNGRIIDFKLL